ncbi:hypothetical protein ACV1EB_21265 [Aeromonas caviae]|uniref:hypothetical protein n=1 Tax=Aeromonas caviae TaxID=648 RepID=UPI0013A6D216|nr:hypothetical protein [Aeromonas caviae]GJB22146.1 hypothetical protein KAM364_40580 [Aeromonas caviae]
MSAIGKFIPKSGAECRINDSSNEVATGADHTAKACLELSQLAAGLRQSMGRFRLA